MDMPLFYPSLAVHGACPIISKAKPVTPFLHIQRLRLREEPGVALPQSKSMAKAR